MSDATFPVGSPPDADSCRAAAAACGVAIDAAAAAGIAKALARLAPGAPRVADPFDVAALRDVLRQLA